MKSTVIYCLLLLFAITSCKKDTVPVDPEEVKIVKDSVSFLLNGKKYVCSEQKSVGVGNRQINIKPSMTLINDQDWEYKTGGFYWYGEKDSLLYDTFFNLASSDHQNRIHISFSKKYHRNELPLKVFNVFVPSDNSKIFKAGLQAFAVDLNLENTMDGISIEVSTQDLKGHLSTYMPAFSILIRTDLTKDIQENSRFEITKVQKLNEKLHLLEGRFEVNLFDDTGKLYKLEKGFFRFTVTMKAFNSN